VTEDPLKAKEAVDVYKKRREKKTFRKKRGDN
jgi:hypothetical protein